MEVSSQISTIQAPVTIQPIVKPELSPENQLKVASTVDGKIEAKSAEDQETKDAQRAFFINQVGTQSKKTQVEIYLSVATEEKVSLQNNTLDSLQILRDIQKQNQAVEAYAAYQSNKPVLY